MPRKPNFVVENRTEIESGLMNAWINEVRSPARRPASMPMPCRSLDTLSEKKRNACRVILKINRPRGRVEFRIKEKSRKIQMKMDEPS